MTATTRPPHERLPEPPRELWRPISWTILLLLVAWSLWGLDARWERLLDAPADLWNLGELLFGDMAFDRTGDLLGDMWESIAIAWLGTIMLFNVWVLIWPNQKKILGMVQASDEEKAQDRDGVDVEQHSHARRRERLVKHA